MTHAMTSRVVFVTPTTLFALCKAVAYGWRAEEQAANADKVAALIGLVDDGAKFTLVPIPGSLLKDAS